MTIHFRRLSMTAVALLAAAAWLSGRVPLTASPAPKAKPPTADEVRMRLFATCWYETSKVVAGKENPNGPLGWMFGPDEVENWQITGELVTDRMIGGVTIDVSAKVWRLDIIRKGERGRVAVLPSIFKFDGDTLVWVTEFPGDGWYQQVDPKGHYKGRPTGFESTGRNRSAVYRMKPCEYLQTTPAKYDWRGRERNERNVHPYAAKHYGTRGWGWEMPWWQRTPDDARRLGPAYARAFLAAIELAAAEAAKEPPEAAAVTVPRWEPHEFVLRGKAHVANPFRGAALVGEFTSPSGKTAVVEGFHDGGDTWKLRFAPWEEGEWKYLLRGEGVELFQRGRLTCAAPRGHGCIGIHKDNPYAFAYSDGTPYFPMGDTCYGLFDDTPITPELREKYLARRREQRFNFVRMSIGHSPHRAAADPARYWAWGGTPDKPDLDRLNPTFFQGMDALLRQMRAKGMNAELLLLNYYRRPFTDPAVWTPDRERLWLRYVTARFAAFPNVFLWTVANEYETHPDGKYRLDVPGDPDWAKEVAHLVKEADPYRHPVTVHPVISASAKAESPRAPFDPPWRVGEFFGGGKEIDVISQQTGQQGEGTAWDDKLKCWTGDSATLVESLRADRRYRKPVLNTESGYEYLRGGPTEKQQVHHTDKVRRTSWRIVCAGGYFAAGFHGTIGHSDVWNRIDAPNRYDFTLKDEGAAGQMALLYDFFTALPYWRMQPFDGVKGDAAVALAEPGEVYVIYLPKGGTLCMDLTGTKGRFRTRWFNPRGGKWTEATETAGGGRPEFAAPDANDWALLLRRTDAGDK